MKLVTYDVDDFPRAGLAVGDYVADLAKASKAEGRAKLPDDTWELFVMGQSASRDAEKLAKKLEKLVKRVAAGKERRPKWLLPQNEVHLNSPILDPQKIICIGMNYRDHVRERERSTGKPVEVPKDPIFFTKFSTSLAGPFDQISLPSSDVSQKVDFEVELALVIGKPLKGVSEEEALEAVAGYMVMNDISARDCQFADQQWCRAKSFDGFGPCGPWLVSSAELEGQGLDPQNLRLWTIVNGVTMQDSNTGEMIHSIGKIVSHVAQAITLIPGDIISTGTPDGVGVFRDPPVLMKAGDIVECGIQGIGTIRNAFK